MGITQWRTHRKAHTSAQDPRGVSMPEGKSTSACEFHVTALATEYKALLAPCCPVLCSYPSLVSCQITPTSPSSGTMVSFHHQFDERDSPTHHPRKLHPSLQFRRPRLRYREQH
jgi:hypothetical protein